MSEIKRMLEDRVTKIADKLDLPWEDVMDVVNEIIFDPFIVADIVGGAIIEKAKKYDKIMEYLSSMEVKNADIQTRDIKKESLLATEKQDV